MIAKMLLPIVIPTLCIMACQKNFIPEASSSTIARAITATSNAAPSMHLNQYFSAQSILKMHKIKIVQTGYAEYFEVNNFNGGYAGLQHTIDSASSGGYTSKTLIASLWDPNTAGNGHAYASYTAPKTVYSRFGGEGDGAKTVNPYGWQPNSWYNIAHRTWLGQDSIHIATFIQDVSTGAWFLTSVLAAPGTSAQLGNYNDTFLENWVGNDDRQDGRFPRKAFFKDCWALSSSGNWLKPSSRNVSVNSSAADEERNGIYHNSFDAGYSASEDAYYMAHGAGVTPSSIFNGTRTASLPAQTGQGATPAITTIVIDSLTSYYGSGAVTVNWVNNAATAPQFSSKIELLNSNNAILKTISDTVPEKRGATFSQTLADGSYTIRLTVTDIFNNTAASLSFPLIINNGNSIKPNAIYELKPISAPGRNLDVHSGSTANETNVSVYTDNNGMNQRWKFIYVGGGYFRLDPVHAAAKSLDVYAAGASPGTNVQIYATHSGSSQQWRFSSAGSGYYKVQPKCAPLLCLNPAATTNANQNVNIGTDTGGNNQKWQLNYIAN